MTDLLFDIGPLAGDCLRAQVAVLGKVMETISADVNARVSKLVAQGHQLAVETATDRHGVVHTRLTTISPDNRRQVLARLQTLGEPPASVQ
jgi:hypothetical protein